MTKLSIIVPIYNVAPYLRKCVDSLLAQDYSDYEIILVDDGSTDESSSICEEYAKIVNSEKLIEKSIRVLHQKNAGLSAARNAGLKLAKGKYVCFVDSDDYWEENVLGKLMVQIEREQLDVLRFNYQNVRFVENQYEVFEPNKTSRYIDTSTEIIDGERYLNERMSYACYAVMFVIRRAIVPTFTEGILYEDTEWTPRMLVAAYRVNATQRIVYNYLLRDGSITKKNNQEHILQKNNSLLQVNASLQNMLQKVKDQRWLYGCIADNVYDILNNVAAYDYESMSYWVKEIKEKNMLPIQGYKVRMMTKLRYGLINLSPRFYCWLRHVRITKL